MFVSASFWVFRFLFAIILLFNAFIFVQNSFIKTVECTESGGCDCKPGYWGNACQFCRLRLTKDSGTITDGNNKYRESSKFTWLIETKRVNSTIELQFDQFATECTWDHFYVYDGKSIKAPLVAVLSGVLRDLSIKKLASRPIIYLHTKSGAVFLYFYSDANYALNGFTVQYRVKRDCSHQCSNHGDCNVRGSCVCESGWTGPSCNVATCPVSCASGTCDITLQRCIGCSSGLTGPSCNITAGKGYWSSIVANNQDVVARRASHTTGVLNGWLWVYGGYSLNEEPFNDLVRYKVSNNSWEVVYPDISSSPARRYGHSMVIFNDSLIVFGGRVAGKEVNELWSFNTQVRQWSRVSLSRDSSTPVAVSGHTATQTKDNKMIVLFGYGPDEGFTRKVQEYDLVSQSWEVFNVSASLVHATYGHSSVYDPVTGGIYVHGGFREALVGESSDEISVYIPQTRKWFTLIRSGYPRFLHSAVLIGNMMLVYGGNTHNETTSSQTRLAKCYSSDFLLFDIRCNVWTKMSSKDLPTLSARFGHSAIRINNTMFMFGGFHGTMMNNILTYTTGDCSVQRDRSSCLQAYPRNGCARTILTGACVGPETAHGKPNESVSRPVCPANPRRCHGFKTCNRCTGSMFGCKWCSRENKCNKSCLHKRTMISSEEKCPVKTTCRGSGCAHPKCDNHTTCDGCTVKKNCMWCESEHKCVALNAYVVSFPYGQCHEWTKDKCTAVQCFAMKTCNDCHTLPGCGWCDDGSGTGLGKCLGGGDDGPFSATNNSSSIESRCLPRGGKMRWFFVECPVCQCNGHSTCDVSDKCSACSHNTNGSHCEMCNTGYFGDSKNGGTCKPCQCNKHATTCDPRSGVCDCLTKGVTGSSCEFCEEGKGYKGNSTNAGHCYYVLASNYMFTFNVSGKTRISFRNFPKKVDRNVQFSIGIIGRPALMNVTYGSTSKPEEPIILLKTIGVSKVSFRYEHYEFGGPSDPAFNVYVYDIKGNVMLEIAFSQPTPFQLLNFFITFFGCFFSILLVTFVAWKIKVRYNGYLMSRQRQVEMRQMASRPSSNINLLLDKHDDTFSRQLFPTAVAQQPYALDNVGVVTVLVRMPTSAAGLAPIGQSGICCASALVSSQNKSSFPGDYLTSNRKKLDQRPMVDNRRSRFAPCI